MAYAFRDQQGVLRVSDQVHDRIQQEVGQNNHIIQINVPHHNGFPVLQHSQDYSTLIARPYLIQLQHANDQQAHVMTEQERMNVESVLLPIVRGLGERRYDFHLATAQTSWLAPVYAKTIQEAKVYGRRLAEYQAQEKKTCLMFALWKQGGRIYRSTRDYTEYAKEGM